MTKRIAVIGGGASGLASAIEAKRQAKKLNIDCVKANNMKTLALKKIYNMLNNGN